MKNNIMCKIQDSLKNFFIIGMLTILMLISYADFSKVSADTAHPDQTSNKDQFLTVTKSARWTNEANGEAQITIQVQSARNETNKIGNMKNADFIFIADTSASAFDGTKMSKSQIERDIILPVAKSVMEGDFANAGNRVAFFEFAQGAFFYSSNSNNSNPQVYTYDYGSDKHNSRTDNRNLALNNSNNEYAKRYKKAYDSITDDFNNNYVKFYTTVNEVTIAINNAANHNSNNPSIDAYDKYTNLDIPLITADYLINKYTSSGRKAYVIFLTDGAPDPIGIAKSGGSYVLSLDGVVTSITGSNRRSGLDSGSGHNSAWLLDSNYGFNALYKYAANQVRSGGNDIYLIKTGTDTSFNGDLLPIWNNITAGTDIQRVSDRNHDLTSNYGDLERNLNEYRRNYPNLFLTNDTSSSSHIYPLTDARSASEGKTRLLAVWEKIKKEIVGTVTTTNVVPQLNCGITDLINTNIFKINGDVNSAVNINTGSKSISGNTVAWSFNDLKYGDKVGNSWPTMTINIKVKDNNSANTWNAWLNTNQNTPSDNNLVVSHNKPGESAMYINVKTPWLFREKKEELGSVYANFLLESADGKITVLSGVSRYANVNAVKLASNQKLKLSSALQGQSVPKNYIYQGYETVAGNVDANNVSSHKKLNSSTDAIYSLSQNSKEATINYYYKETFATIEVVHIAVNNSYKYITPALYGTSNNKYGENKTFKPQNNDSYYDYIGYEVLDAKSTRPIMPKYNSSYNFSGGKSVNVKPEIGKANYLVVFAYKEKPIKTPAIEIVHWDDSHNKEIIPPHIRDNKRISYDNIYDLLCALQSNGHTISLETFNEKAKQGLPSLIQYAEDVWNNSNNLNIRSINPLSKDQYHFKTDNTINIELYGDANKNKSYVGFDATEINNQYKISIASLGQKIADYSKDKKITLVLHYDVDFVVTFEHYINNSSQKIGTSTTKSAKLNETVTKDGEPVNRINYKNTWYSYCDKYEVIPNNNIIINKAGPTTEVSSVKSDLLIKLYYEADRKVTIKHYIKNTNREIGNTKTISIPYNSSQEIMDEPIQSITDDNGVNYTYCGEFNVSTEGNVTIEKGIPPIKIQNLTKDLTINLYYEPAKKVTVQHRDKDNQSVKVGEDVVESVSYGGTKEVTALVQKGGTITNADGSFYYKFEGNNDDILYNPNSLNTTYDSNQKVTINGITADCTITFLYQKYWPITIKYIEKSTGNPIADDDHAEVKNNGSTEIERKIIDKYTYLSFDTTQGNSGVGTKAPITNANTPIVVTFYYQKKPEITGDYKPEPPVDQFGDPEEPGNPFKDYTDKGGKVIVLDEIFTVKYKIDNYDSAEKESKVTIEFPFDTYMISAPSGYQDININGKKLPNNPANNQNGVFVEAGNQIIVDIIKPGVAETEKDGAYTFRLPSWIKEGQYTNSVLKITEIDTGNVISEQTLTIMVIGRLYDFRVTNIGGINVQNQSSSPSYWHKNLFEDKNLGREYRADTLPIGQLKVEPNLSKLDYPNANNNIQNPVYPYGMSLGTHFLFSVNTKGLASENIVITPKLVFVGTDGNINPNVKYMYKTMGTGEVEFANKDGVITTNGGSFITAINDSLRLSEEVRLEMNKAGTLMIAGDGLLATRNDSKLDRYTYSNFINAYKPITSSINWGTSGGTDYSGSQYSPLTKVNFGNYGKLNIPIGLRLPYANYASSVLKFAEVHRIGRDYDYNTGNIKPIDTSSEIKHNKNILNYIVNNNNYQNSISANQQYMANNIGSDKILENDLLLINSLGHWYAEYKLPGSLVVRDSRTNEVIKDGFIIVKFKISTTTTITSSDGTKKKWTYLSYMKKQTTNEFETQWQLENANITNTNQKVHTYLPTIINASNKEVDIDFSDGYYPVAIYQAGVSINDMYEVAGTH